MNWTELTKNMKEKNSSSFGCPLTYMTRCSIFSLLFLLFCSDILEERLQLAKSLGATHTIQFSKEDTDPKINATRIVKELDQEADVAIECSASALCLHSAVYVRLVYLFE